MLRQLLPCGEPCFDRVARMGYSTETLNPWEGGKGGKPRSWCEADPSRQPDMEDDGTLWLCLWKHF